MPDAIDQIARIKPKCDRCGWKHGGFHICVDLSTPEPRLPRKIGPMSQEQKEAIAESQRRRQEEIRGRNQARDLKMIQRYEAGGIGTAALAKEFGISRTTALKILNRAGVRMRRRGQTVAKGY